MQKKEEKTEQETQNSIETAEGTVTFPPEKTTGKGGKKKKRKKTGPRIVNGKGHAHIKATYNNTIVTITDLSGNAIIWSSAGKCGFKGPKKSTPYAAGVIVKSIVDYAKQCGIREVDVFVKGVGSGREAAIRALGANGIQVASIRDVTGTPHNGCRPPKPRRV